MPESSLGGHAFETFSFYPSKGASITAVGIASDGTLLMGQHAVYLEGAARLLRALRPDRSYEELIWIDPDRGVSRVVERLKGGTRGLATSPDGETVAVLRPKSENSCELILFRADGTKWALPVQTGYGAQYNWSDDGRSLLLSGLARSVLVKIGDAGEPSTERCAIGAPATYSALARTWLYLGHPAGLCEVPLGQERDPPYRILDYANLADRILELTASPSGRHVLVRYRHSLRLVDATSEWAVIAEKPIALSRPGGITSCWINEEFIATASDRVFEILRAPTLETIYRRAEPATRVVAGMRQGFLRICFWRSEQGFTLTLRPDQ